MSFTLISGQFRFLSHEVAGCRSATSLLREASSSCSASCRTRSRVAGVSRGRGPARGADQQHHWTVTHSKQGLRDSGSACPEQRSDRCSVSDTSSGTDNGVAEPGRGSPLARQRHFSGRHPSEWPITEWPLRVRLTIDPPQRNCRFGTTSPLAPASTKDRSPPIVEGQTEARSASS
jgi:hypothetical protein